MTPDTTLDTITSIEEFRSPIAKEALKFYEVAFEEIAPLSIQWVQDPLNAIEEHPAAYGVKHGLRVTMKTMAVLGAMQCELAEHDFQAPYRVGDMGIPQEKLPNGLTPETVLYQTMTWKQPFPREYSAILGVRYLNTAESIRPGLFIDDILHPGNENQAETKQ